MSENQAIVHRENSLMTNEEVTSTEVVLQRLIDSKKLPAHIKTLDDAIVVRQFGKEIGLEFMQAAHYLYPVNGRLTLSTAGMSALLRKKGIKWQTIKDAEPIKNEKGDTVDLVTEIKFFRDGIEEISTFTYKEAVEAELAKKDVWIKFRRLMLWNRAFSVGARRIGMDALMGLGYLVEELDDKGVYTFDAEGNPIITK